MCAQYRLSALRTLLFKVIRKGVIKAMVVVGVLKSCCTFAAKRD